MDRLQTLRGCQHVLSRAHHDNSLQARLHSSCMSHTHIRGEYNICCLCKITNGSRDSLLWSRIVCVDINTQAARVCLVGKITCASVGFSPVCGCVFMHSPAAAVINSCHYKVQESRKSACWGRTMVCRTPALVGKPRTTVMKRSALNKDQHLAHIVHLLLLP